MSLISAIAGYVIPHPFVSSVIAIWAGHRAKKEIRESGGAQDGDTYATMGLVLGYVHLVMSVVGCVFAIVWLGAILAFFGVAMGAAAHGAH